MQQPANRKAFRIVKLPRLGEDELSTAEEETLIDQYRAFRLHALKNDPGVFASSFSEENGQSRDFWRERLANPKAMNLIAVTAESPVPSSATWTVESEWCGMVTLLGPTMEQNEHGGKSSWSKVPSVTWDHSNPLQTAREYCSTPQDLSYHVMGAYIADGYRRVGCGKALLIRCIELASKDCAQMSASSCTIGVHVDTFNAPARVLYEKVGFVVISEEVYPERESEDGLQPARAAFLLQYKLLV